MKKGLTHMPGCMTYQSATIDKPNLIVDAFVRFFSSVYQHSNQRNSYVFHKITGTCININKISEENVYRAICKLKNKLTAFLIKDCAYVFTPVLTHIFNLALRSESFPHIWKISLLKYFSEISTVFVLFNAFVRPQLEYNAIIWLPTAVEKCQSKFLMYLSFKKEGCFPSRGIAQIDLLAKHKIRSSERRRFDAAISFLYKLFHNKICCEPLLANFNIKAPTLSTRSQEVFVLPIPKSNVLKRSPVYFISESDQTLSRPEFVHDLNVYFDPKLAFTHHINVIIQDCFKSYSFIIRNSREFMNTSISKIEYANIIWFPYWVTYIANIERIQRRFLKS
ncbi:hypothetical protein BDFB_004349, partial [Asbolus verrucosus]